GGEVAVVQGTSVKLTDPPVGVGVRVTVLLVEGASIDDRADRLVDDGTIVELLVETGQVLLEPATNHPAQLVVLRPDGAVQDVQIDHVGHQRKTHDGKLSTSTAIPRRHRSRIHVALHPSYGHPRESPLLAPAQLGQVALFVLGRLSAVSPRFSKHPLTCGTAAYPGAMSTKRL